MSTQPDLGKLSRVAMKTEAAGTWNKALGTQVDTLLPISEAEFGHTEPKKSYPVAAGEAHAQTEVIGEMETNPPLKFKRFSYAGFERVLAACCGTNMPAPVTIGGETVVYRHVFYPRKWNGVICTLAGHGGNASPTGNDYGPVQEVPSVKFVGFKLSGKDGSVPFEFDLKTIGNHVNQLAVDTGMVNTKAIIDALSYGGSGVPGQDVYEMAMLLTHMRTGWIRIREVLTSGDVALSATDNCYPRAYEMDFDHGKYKGVATGLDEVDEPSPEGQSETKGKLDFAGYNYFPGMDGIQKILNDMRKKATGAATAKYYKMEVMLQHPKTIGNTAHYSLKIKFPKLAITADDPKFVTTGLRGTALNYVALQPDVTPTGMTIYNTESAPWEMELTSLKTSADI